MAGEVEGEDEAAVRRRRRVAASPAGGMVWWRKGRKLLDRKGKKNGWDPVALVVAPFCSRFGGTLASTATTPTIRLS